jgi:phosphinothricin acetyltransferase
LSEGQPESIARLVDFTFERHAEGIREILNDAILNSTALYDYETRTMKNLRDWFDEKASLGLPIIGLEGDEGQVLGMATYGSFRSKAAYRFSVEHSVYVHKDARGLGYGRRLLQAIIERARARGVHTMIGVIDRENQVSIELHKRLGFSYGGELREVGFKFNSWLDIVFYQRIFQ